MIVKSFSGHRTPANANHYLGQITRQRNSETWYSTDNSQEDHTAFLPETKWHYQSQTITQFGGEYGYRN